MLLAVKINGEEREVQAQTVSALLQELEISTTGIAVEKNRKIVPRSLLEKEPLSSGDCIEIVQCVAGG